MVSKYLLQGDELHDQQQGTDRETDPAECRGPADQDPGAGLLDDDLRGHGRRVAGRARRHYRRNVIRQGWGEWLHAISPFPSILVSG